MSRPPNQPEGNDMGDGGVPIHNGRPDYYEPIADAILALAEQGRERNAIRREIALRGLEFSESSEQRQHDLSLKQIDATNIQHQRRYGLGRLIIIIAGVAALFLLALLGFVVAMAFFGNPMQSQTALTMLGYAFAAVGGGGILLLIALGVNSVSKWWQGL